MLDLDLHFEYSQNLGHLRQEPEKEHQRHSQPFSRSWGTWHFLRLKKISHKSCLYVCLNCHNACLTCVFIADENGLCPSWSNEKFVFNLTYPELCLLRFVIYHRDTFDEKSIVGQATFPVSCIRQGFRSIRLNNEYTESSELSTLLVHIHIQSLKVSYCSWSRTCLFIFYISGWIRRKAKQFHKDALQFGGKYQSNAQAKHVTQ